MGRKAKFNEGVLVKKGPGKKAKKQKDPVLPKSLKGIFNIQTLRQMLIILHSVPKISENF